MRSFRKAFHWIAVLSFGTLSVSGQALHLLPGFSHGVHAKSERHCCCSHRGHKHAPSESHAGDHRGIAPHKIAYSDCDGACQICAYLAQGRLKPDRARPPERAGVVSLRGLHCPLIYVTRTARPYSPRGPPLLVALS